MTALASQTAAGAIAAKSRIPIAQRRKARRLVVQATYQHLLSGSTPGAIE
jgi:transcription termination factor NusB